MDFEWRRNGETDLNKRKEKEWLTQEIAVQYYKKAQRMRGNTGQDIGGFRKLKNELMVRCDVTEIEAVNILKGYHISDYIKKYEILSGKAVLQIDANKRRENRELIYKIAELEDELRKVAMENENI